MKSFKEFVGKTVETVDDSAVNAVTFTFTDGSEVTVFAECGTSEYDIPFFELQS